MLNTAKDIFSLIKEISFRSKNAEISALRVKYIHPLGSKQGGLFSIVIPTRDKVELLKNCVDSIRRNSDSDEYELIIIDNGSRKRETLEYLSKLKDEGVKVSHSPGKFNYSKLCNLGSSISSGSFICFLNNDAEILENNWIKTAKTTASAENIGFVGAHLFFSDGTIQHVGVSLGFGGIAGLPGRNKVATATFLQAVLGKCYEVSAISFAFAVIEKSKLDQIGVLDENLPRGFNDVDMCLRARDIGFTNLVSGLNLLHLESATRKNPKSMSSFVKTAIDNYRFIKKWGYIAQDPCMKIEFK